MIYIVISNNIEIIHYLLSARQDYLESLRYKDLSKIRRALSILNISLLITSSHRTLKSRIFVVSWISRNVCDYGAPDSLILLSTDDKSSTTRSYAIESNPITTFLFNFGEVEQLIAVLYPLESSRWETFSETAALISIDTDG